MNNYQASLKKLVVLLNALILVCGTSPVACWAANDESLPGLNVLRAPQPEPVSKMETKSEIPDDGLLKKNSPLPPLNKASSSSTASSSTVKNAEAIDKDMATQYTLGPGDVLSITDYGLRDDQAFPTQTVTVLPDGTVNVYPVGLMKLTGLTVKQFNDQVNEKAKELVVEPQYVVNIVQARPISVYVLGEVANPGLYSFSAGGDVSGPAFGNEMSPMGRMIRRGVGPFGKTQGRQGLSPDMKNTGQLLGAVYGAKFAQWAPKWGAVGGLAAYGMQKKGGGDSDDSQLPGMSSSAQPFVPPGSGTPAKNLNSLTGGYTSLSGNYGSLSFNDVASGVDPVLPGLGPTGGPMRRSGFAPGGFSQGGYGGSGGMGSYSSGSSGGMSSPMVIPAQASVNVNNVTVMNAIERAGGLRDTANVRRIQVRRAVGKEVINVDVWKLVNEGDVTQDVVMQPNDTIFVPQGGADFNPDALGALAAYKGRWVRVLGSVRSPGLVELRPNDDIYSVLARAGGFVSSAATRSVLLSRMNRDGTVFSKRISLPKGMKDREALARLPVQSGDVVIASTSLIKTVGTEVLRAGMITGLAMLVIYFSNKVTNVNVQTNDEGQPTNNARVAVF